MPKFNIIICRHAHFSNTMQYEYVVEAETAYEAIDKAKTAAEQEPLEVLLEDYDYSEYATVRCKLENAVSLVK